MTIGGVNHVTLAVADLSRSVTFYRDTLGARLRAQWDRGAYLTLGDLWLCLALGPVTARSDYTHIAFSCAPEDIARLAGQLSDSQLWQANRSEGASLYLLDPDGHRLELHAGDLQSRLDHYRRHPDRGVTIFD